MAYPPGGGQGARRPLARRCAAFEMKVVIADPFIPRRAVEGQGYRYVQDFRDALGDVLRGARELKISSWSKLWAETKIIKADVYEPFVTGRPNVGAAAPIDDCVYPISERDRMIGGPLERKAIQRE